MMQGQHSIAKKASPDMILLMGEALNYRKLRTLIGKR
jgi:hypothetical protein